MNAALFLPAQQKQTNRRHVKGRKKLSHTHWTFVSHIFILYGLDLGLYKKTRFKSILLRFMRICSIFFNLYSLVFLLSMLFKMNYRDVNYQKLLISSYVFNLSGNVSWFIINKFKEKISYLFQKMKK